MEILVSLTLTVIVPVLAGTAVTWMSHRGLPAQGTARHRLPPILGFVAAYLLGYAGQFWPLEWPPERYDDWLPYLVGMAGLAGAVVQAPGITWLERAGVYLGISWLAAWFLLPGWPKLDESRVMLLAGFTFYLATLMIALDLVASRRTSWRGWLLLLTVTAVAATGCTFVELSVQSGRLVAVGTVALLALIVLAPHEPEEQRWLRAIVPAFVIAIAGSVFIAMIYPTPPRWAFLLLPLGPVLVAWLEIGPARAWPTRRRRWLEVACVAVGLVAVSLWLVLASYFN